MSDRVSTADVRALARAPEGTPLYVHLPFCATKCHYCDFFSVPDAGQDVDGTIDALLLEAQQRAPRRPRTVFFGGGTPSLLSAKQLERLLDRLDELTAFRTSAEEVSAECNPESLDEAKARRLVELGVSRLSIGFQSLSDDALAKLGRVHTAEQSMRAYDAARGAGASSVNVDLIFALPDQRPEQWEADLARVLALGPDHLSAYGLTYEPGTRFHLLLRRGELARQSEEAELEMFRVTRRRCRAAGLAAYEISNHARPRAECRHNLNYWRNGPYIGLGPSAVSKVGQVRGGNRRGLAAWRRAIERERQAIAWSESLDALGRLAETWWLGLRLASGVEPAEARESAAFGAAVDPALEVAEGLASRGFLECRGGRWRLSERGLPLADALAAEFLAAARDPLAARPA